MSRSLPVLIGSLLIAPYAGANYDITDNVALSGFGSTSWAKSNNEMPLLINRDISDSSCFDCDTTLGLQLDIYYEAFKASAQLVKRPQDDWSNPELEWAYVGYNNGPWTVQLGRLRNPLFLYSEYYYVGQAYTPARPPGEVYNSILGITFYEGGSLTYTYDFAEEYSLAITPFFGLEDNKKIQLNDVTLLELNTHNMLGLNFTLSNDNSRWNLSYLKSKYDQKVTLFNFSLPEEKDNTIELFSLGAEYEFDNVTLTAEAQKNDRTYSWYLMSAIQLNSFKPYLSYAQQYNDDHKLDGDSVLLGTRYDLLYNVSLNAEWQYFNAEEDQNGSFIDTPNSKNHAQLFTIMINFVF
ncbi:sulfate ABC transporter permease [Vibrio ponticus]|uniref:Sulfate ABC transporter permease n=1 Tax=Vibrio ponticus TaxID=265668 RepID=A0ABX3F452_9VIBR|nr:porin [Vibrio ponticus]OLQ84302.1 sulfate ABC transporter permease [Vibrio ponticus]